MKIVYVAGPFRALTTWQIECNIHRAAELGAEVCKRGAMALVPHRNTAHFDGIQPDEFWLAGTLELMRRCDAVITVDGWQRSQGAMKEVEEAWRLGIPVFHELKGLERYLAQ